jgi:hypothetical protein
MKQQVKMKEGYMCGMKERLLSRFLILSIEFLIEIDNDVNGVDRKDEKTI